MMKLTKHVFLLMFGLIILCIEGWSQGIRVVEIPTGPPPTTINALKYLSRIKGPSQQAIPAVDNTNAGIDITLNEDGKINIMPFFERAEALLNQSPYQNMAFISQIFLGNIYYEIIDLCRSLESSEQKLLCEEDFKDVTQVTEERWKEAQARRVLFPNDYIPLGGP